MRPFGTPEEQSKIIKVLAFARKSQTEDRSSDETFLSVNSILFYDLTLCLNFDPYEETKGLNKRLSDLVSLLRNMRSSRSYICTHMHKEHHVEIKISFT